MKLYFTGWVNRFANAGDTAVEIAETTAVRVSISFVLCLLYCFVCLYAIGKRLERGGLGNRLKGVNF